MYCGSRAMEGKGSMYKGQLKLRVTAIGNNLQVDVIEAANLHSRWTDLCDPYIQLQVCPDEDSSTKLQTETLNGTNPYYDAKLHVPVKATAGDKQRLVVSAWHRDKQKNCSEFLGCMSFGVKHLLRKGKRQDHAICGWYHLLPDNLGHRKHLSCESTSTSSSSAPPRSSDHPAHPLDLSRLGGMSIGGVKLGPGQTHSCNLRNNGNGYGFTVRGSCPVRVGRVREHGQAHLAGLRHNDIILNINAVNVTRSGAESVAQMIKNCRDELTIDMFRRNKRANSSLSSRSCTSSRASSIPSIDLNYALIHSEDNDENTCPSVNESVLKRRVIGSSCQHLVTEQPRGDGVLNPMNPPMHPNHVYHIITDNNNVSVKTEKGSGDKSIFNESNVTVWNPEVSPIGRPDPTGRPQLKNYISVPSLRNFSPTDSTTQLTQTAMRAPDTTRVPDTTWAEEIDSINDSGDMSCIDGYATTETELPWNPNECTQISAQQEYSRFSNFDDLSASDLNETGLETTTNQSAMHGIGLNSPSFVSSSATTIQETSQSPLSEDIAILADLERDYSHTLHSAMDAYSHPLRHCHVSAKQHQCLFQNMGKMAVISSFVAKQLEQENDVNVYSDRVSMICDALETYIRGLPQARTLHDELQGMDSLRPFLSLTARNHGIALEEVLMLPLQHLDSLITHLQAMLSTTQDPAELSKLSPVLSSLLRLYPSSNPGTPTQRTLNETAITESESASVSQIVSPVFSVLSQTTPAPRIGTRIGKGEESGRRSRGLRGRSQYRGSGVNVTMPCSGSASDIVDLQKRLVIPRHIKKFKLARSQRHLVYSGEVLRIQDGSQKRLLVLLLSDLMLITREMGNGRLFLTEEPILLEALSTEWDTENDCEFLLHWLSSTGNRSVALYTDDPQQKCVWQSILDHRISLNQEADETHTVLDVL